MFSKLYPPLPDYLPTAFGRAEFNRVLRRRQLVEDTCLGIITISTLALILIVWSLS